MKIELLQNKVLYSRARNIQEEIFVTFVDMFLNRGGGSRKIILGGGHHLL